MRREPQNYVFDKISNRESQQYRQAAKLVRVRRGAVPPSQATSSDGNSEGSCVKSPSVTCWRRQEKRPQTKNRRSILGRAKCDRPACRSNTRTLRAQPAQHRSERNAPTWGPSQSPRNPQRLSAANHGKTKDNLRLPLIRGLNQWIGGARQSAAKLLTTTAGGSLRMSPSCRSY
jgi:hypothetical protein